MPFGNLVMKSLLCLALIIPGTAFAWTTETPAEFIGEGDFDGDGNNDVLVLDKATGAYRIGYQTPPGTLTWSTSRASGITNVTGASIGKLFSTARSTLAVTSPYGNRINLLDASTASTPALPVPVYISSMGPNMVVALDIGGAGNTAHDDLYIGSRENPGPGESLVRNTGASQTLISDTLTSAIHSQGNTFVMKTGSPARLGIFHRLPSPGNDVFTIMNFSSGSPVTEVTLTVLSGNVPPPEFVAARFSAANAYAQVLFYNPANSNIVKWQVQEPLANLFALSDSNSFNLGQPIQRLQLISNGATPRLAAFFGTTHTQIFTATVYDFDGTNAPVPVQSFTNLAGFTGLADLGGGNWTALSGNGSGRTTDYKTWLSSGGTYIPGTGGALPEINPYSGVANVLLFAGEPFVNANARVLKGLKSGDWSSGLILAGGPPPNVTVTTESYAGMSNGLKNPTAVNLGASPVGTTHGLVNQYTNPISIFSRRSALGDIPAEVAIAPAAGEYAKAISIKLTVNTSGWFVYYRLSPQASWQFYSAPLVLYTNTTVEFFAWEFFGSRKTMVQSSAYRFTASAGTMDSDGDGVPDAVEIAKGLNPLNSGADSDGDGYTDLEELIRNTNPNNKLDAPSNAPPVDFAASFDLYTTPHAFNAVGNDNLCLTGVVLNAWSLDGAALAQAPATNHALLGVTNPAAWLRSITPGPHDRLVIQSTDSHFDLDIPAADKHLGRELVGFITPPKIVLPDLPAVDFSLGAGAVDAWIATAANILTNRVRPAYVDSLTYRDTLEAALLETKVSQILVARGTNAATNMTLFPFRAADAGRINFSAEALASIESYASSLLPAYKWQTLHDYFQANLLTPPTSEINSLRALAAQLCQISAALNNTNPSAFKLPLDEFRNFISTGTLNPGYYSNLPSASILTPAWIGASNLLAGVPPRPTTNLIIKAVNSGSGMPITFRDLPNTTNITLWDINGKPVELPPNFEVLPDSQFTLFGHTDITSSQPGFPVEVISLSMASVPLASDQDANGNLLIDSWENVFFGNTNVNPLADDDGDGYSNLQEMLAGTDPNNALNQPVGPVVVFTLPTLNITLLGPSTRIYFTWPASYISLFNFGLKTATALDSGFGDYPVGAPIHLGGDNWMLDIAPPPANMRFYYLTLGLK
jgi:hypothetical protein